MPRDPERPAALPPFLDTFFPECYHGGDRTPIIPAIRLFLPFGGGMKGDRACLPEWEVRPLVIMTVGESPHFLLVQYDCLLAPDGPSVRASLKGGFSLNIFDIMGPVMVGPIPRAR